jgi:hypothetical protein
MSDVTMMFAPSVCIAIRSALSVETLVCAHAAVVAIRTAMRAKNFFILFDVYFSIDSPDSCFN